MEWLAKVLLVAGANCILSSSLSNEQHCDDCDDNYYRAYNRV
jgi:hypothetical protein